jgi:hypothetical protein
MSEECEDKEKELSAFQRIKLHAAELIGDKDSPAWKEFVEASPQEHKQ